MNKLTAQIEEVKKGCGELPSESSYTYCGRISKITGKNVICNGCKAKLATLEQCQKWEAEREKEEIEFLEMLREKEGLTPRGETIVRNKIQALKKNET
jgi:flagellar biosynthesis/type III secretory pathway ATPase